MILYFKKNVRYQHLTNYTTISTQRPHKYLKNRHKKKEIQDSDDQQFTLYHKYFNIMTTLHKMKNFLQKKINFFLHPKTKPTRTYWYISKFITSRNLINFDLFP